MSHRMSHVTEEEYYAIKKELEIEKEEHLATKAKLAVVSEKLEFALGEVGILNRQLQKEKEAFQEAFGHLKDTAFQQKYHALQLKEKYSEIEKVCDRQDDVILAKDIAIKDLKSRLNEQKKTYRRQLDDKEIHLQQERYLAQNCLSTNNPLRKQDRK